MLIYLFNRFRDLQFILVHLIFGGLDNYILCKIYCLGKRISVGNILFGGNKFFYLRVKNLNRQIEIDKKKFLGLGLSKQMYVTVNQTGTRPEPVTQ